MKTDARERGLLRLFAGVPVLMAVLTVSCATGRPPSPTPTLPRSIAAWCWTALPKTDPRDAADTDSAVSIAPVDDDDVWVGSNDAEGAHLLHFSKGQWRDGDLPRLGAAGATPPMDGSVAVRNGHVYAGWREEDKNWQSHGRVAAPDATRSRMLGDVRSARAGAPTIAIGADGSPLVAWAELIPGRGGGVEESIHVARWTGTTWSPVGPPLDLDGGTPSITIDAVGTPLVAWVHAPRTAPRVRVAHWTGTSWVGFGEVGREGGTICGRPRPHIVTTTQRHVIVSWRATAGCHSEPTIAMFEWTGERWETLPMPPEASARFLGEPALDVLTDGSTVVAWSVELGGEPSSVFITRRVGNRWETVARAMQADQGQSDTRNVAIARRASGGFFLGWEESAADHRKIRVARFAPCARGERPAPIPTSRTRESYWPKTVDEAVVQLLATMSEESKQKVRATSRDDLIQFHLGWGMGIRNAFGLWRGNDSLMKSCNVGHPDDCSMIIIERVWERLQAADGG